MKNKEYIANIISQESKISKKQSKKILDKFLSVIKKNSIKMDVKISGFGTFYKHVTPKRIGRNPITKQSYIIESRDKINFRASNKLKEVLN